MNVGGVRIKLIIKGDWEGVTAEEFMGRLEAYLVYYREERIKKSLGWLSPMEYRRKLGYA